VRRELAEADALASALVAAENGPTTLVAVFDPGRRGGGEGRVLIWRSGCSASARPDIALEAVASSVLRAAGLPQSRELPDPPRFCAWPDAAGVVASYGVRAEAAGGHGEDAAYLEDLRSLGYL
jgi:hypothetical protein